MSKSVSCDCFATSAPCPSSLDRAVFRAPRAEVRPEHVHRGLQGGRQAGREGELHGRLPPAGVRPRGCTDSGEKQFMGYARFFCASMI